MYATGIIHTFRHSLCTQHRLQYTWRIPLAFLISPCWFPLLPFPIPLYLLGTLLAVTGSVHLGLRLLVNWPPPLSYPFPKPSPSKFPEPKLPSALLRRPQDESGVFCPEQLELSSPITNAFAFAFSLSRAPYFSWFFTCLILVFCALTFAPVRLYIFTARRGQPEQEIPENHTARTGPPEQDSQNRIARTRQAEQDRQNRTGRTGQAEQDRQNRIARTG